MKTCPFCNAAIADETVRTPSGRITCRRCGESFADPSRSAGVELPIRGASVPAVKRETHGIRWKMIFLFSLPFIAAGVAYFIPNSEKVPPPRDHSDEERGAVAPLKMKALGYLPMKLDAVFAFRNPAEHPMLLKPFAAVNQSLLDAIALDLGEVQELVVGLRINPMGAFAVIRTSLATPLEERLRNQKYKLTRENGRRLFEVVGGKSFLNPVLWQPDPFIIVAALSPTDAGEFSERSLDPQSILRGEIYSRIEALPRSASSWLVVHRDRWDDLKQGARLVPALKRFAERLEALDELDAVVAWHSIDVPGTIQMQIDLKTGVKGTPLRNLLTEVVPSTSEQEIVTRYGIEIHEDQIQKWKERFLK